MKFTKVPKSHYRAHSAGRKKQAPEHIERGGASCVRRPSERATRPSHIVVPHRDRASPRHRRRLHRRRRRAVVLCSLEREREGARGSEREREGARGAEEEARTCPGGYSTERARQLRLAEERHYHTSSVSLPSSSLRLSPSPRSSSYVRVPTHRAISFSLAPNAVQRTATGLRPQPSCMCACVIRALSFYVFAPGLFCALFVAFFYSLLCRRKSEPPGEEREREREKAGKTFILYLLLLCIRRAATWTLQLKKARIFSLLHRPNKQTGRINVCIPKKFYKFLLLSSFHNILTFDAMQENTLEFPNKLITCLIQNESPQ